MEIILAVLITVIICAPVGVITGVQIRKRTSEKTIGSAEEEAKRIVEDGIKIAESKKKEALVEAKEENLKLKNEVEREIKERRKEVSRLEERVIQRESTLDKKIDAAERRDEQLQAIIKGNEKKTAEIAAVHQKQVEKLEEISGLTSEQAKGELIQAVEDEARFEAAQKLMEIEAQTKEIADEKAKNIITMSIQRLASEYVAETTVSVVPLPSDEMKGRIIGREGRNIRTIEVLTGCDLNIDDTPEVITLSCFDPVRREIARLTLEKLISDGRIHPTRIEEMVAKSKREIDLSIKQAGDRAIFETGIHGVNAELVKILGRLRYRTSYGQNVLAHSIEVAFISAMIADEIGANSAIAKRAGLLHDIGKAMTAEVEGSHVQIGVDLAKKFKEKPDVIHAIEAHHGDVEARTLVAMIVQAADAISAARPGARRENVENFIKRLRRLEEIATEFKGVEKAFAIQAGREVRVMVKPEEVNDAGMVSVARQIVKKIEDELNYPGQIKVNIIRESRASEIAK
ncbi:MAG: ribonuclease Y [Oscillospiraceae bacterium]|nr:ribonuclease Y [Oscillospiraceae bacterium]